MKLKICLMAALCLFLKVSGQSNPISGGYSVGDIVPDITINNIINYPNNTTKISDFKDKLIILDFWATWCSACVQHMPETYAIQQKYADQVMVLLVNSRATRDKEKDIKEFFKRRKSLFEFPCVLLDTALTKLFPHRAMPHYVILKNYKVVAITESDEISIANIGRLLADNKSTLYLKNDFKLLKAKPLFIDGNALEIPKNFYRTIFTGKIPHVGNFDGFSFDSNNSVERIYAVNYSETMLFLMAYPDYAKFGERILMNIPYPERLINDAADRSDLSSQVFSYESTFQPVSKKAALKIMQSDLDRYFRCRIDSQLRDTDCLILKINREKPPEKVLPGIKSESHIGTETALQNYFHNYEVEYLRSELERVLKMPVFNETGYNEPISLELPAQILDIKKLAESLKEQGFTFSKQRRKVYYMTLTQYQ